MRRGAAIALVSAVGGALLAPAVPLAADDPPPMLHAVLDAATNPVPPGATVRLDSSRSSGEIVDHLWDLDGDGSFETDTGAVPSADATPVGERTVHVRVVDARGQSDEASVELRVQPAMRPRAPRATPPRPAPAAPAPTPTPVRHSAAATTPRSAPVAPVRKRTAAGHRVRAAAATGVTIKNFLFAPRAITVHVGDSVSWTNEDSAPHTATANDGSFDTGQLAKGKSGSHTFTKAGTFAYICSIHPSMKGTVTVAAAVATPAAPGTTTPAAPSAGAGAGSGGSSLPQTGLNLAPVVLLAALMTGTGTLLRRRLLRN